MDRREEKQMKMSCRIGRWGIMFAMGFLMLLWTPIALCEQPDNPPQTDASRYVAYYFFTNKRCGPCIRIEQWSQEAITQSFKEDIQSGKLQWQALNVEKAENAHYIKDFQLYTKSVIIAEYNADKLVRWNNLKDVWKLYRNEEKYFDYVVRETRSFMEKD